MAITEYEDKIQEIIDKNDHDSFITDFLSVYEKIPRSTITKLRKGIGRVNLSKEPGEVYLKNKLYYKETDQPLMQVYADLERKVSDLGSKPRYIFVTDFKDILAKDTKTDDSLSIKFEDLPQYFEFFLAWNGIEKVDFDKENPADVRAAERFAKLYDIITRDNPTATAHGLNLFLIRLLFCLFAEDTGMFKRDEFTNDIMAYTKADGSDLDEFIKKLFENLDVHEEQREASLPSWVKKYPYVDGDLFIEPHEPLKFTTESRTKIIDAGKKLDWASINPDILGSMLQAVASEDKRSHLGMHYTSVPNIMKVIKPLFLDDLREEFENARGNVDRLNELYARIGKIKFMDPACGSGNFLIITYKELRQLEIDILKELNNMGTSTMYVPSVTLDQFYGIEIEDFACDVTRLSLWIAEHQMNVKLHQEIKDAVRPTLPLKKAGDIICGNALRLDWSKILPHEEKDEVYLFGNPPYLGARRQEKEQKADLNYALPEVKKVNSLDYVAGWFYKGMEYSKGTAARYAFVTTNSICQGEQVSILWPKIFEQGGEIIFAYNSIKWSNNAKNNAGVMFDIVGVADSRFFDGSKKIYGKQGMKVASNISPYLTEGSNTVVYSRKDQIDGLPQILFGSMPNDGGYLTFSAEEYKQLPSSARKLCKKLVGSEELINGKQRYCLWLYGVDPSQYTGIPEVMQIISNVKSQRLASKRKATRDLATSPELFGEVRWKSENAIIIPRVSSENRIYVPMGYVDENTVISDSAFTVYDAPLWLLGLLESRIHMAWLRAVGGKLETRYRYSAGLVYNTFPVPEMSTRRKNEIENLVLNILDIREEEGGTLAELYGSPLAEKNPKPMNARLLEAHQELDRVVDRAYKPSGFKDDAERLSMLLEMYAEKVKDVK
ncbi:DNA methyltransferase [Lactobacillus delbrueckii subsp. bulgaricus]|nr:DNA methyltransferase [Lactobacillus delbrueckii subsp. bulgaricus]MBT8853833.1 DNA methyltransferase [Lactobacillus delbrueckii subsp. bulgaricus]MBT8857864.1 DNA methyltransferase [Lactobacillus delbrueckii subsp. bulgaricus]MBT8866398.1 DNA methyltransferase [Lactobacillus delbrueckii subsp. bulgaricus]